MFSPRNFSPKFPTKMLPSGSIPALPLKYINSIPSSTYKKFLWTLLPSFFTTKQSQTDHGGISALDGLRGIACLFVVNEHLTYNFSTVFLREFGFEGQHWMIQWPFVRIMFCGWSMVNVFFVISGYVLTYKPFKQIHKRDFAGARTSLASSTFRRAMRLYLPMWTIVLACAFFTWLGAFNQSIKVWTTNKNQWHLHEGPPLHFQTFYTQMADGVYYAWKMLNIFNFNDADLHAEHYDKHTWTIPVEFRCSLMLFAAVLAVSQTRPAWRIGVLTFVSAIVMQFKQRNTSLFLTGAVLADFDHHVRAMIQRQQSLEYDGTESRWVKFIVKWLHPESGFYPLIFTLGIYFLCVPVMGSPVDPFYAFPMRFVPFQWIIGPDWWFRTYGSVLVVWAVANSTILKPIFVNRYVTYLGKISFALYLVHGDLLRSLLYAAVPTIYAITGDGTWENQTSGQMFLSWLLGAILIVPLSFWLSDLFWRFVDMPFTKLARRIEVYMHDSDDEPEKPVLLK